MSHAAVGAAVVVGALAVVTIFVAIGMVWIRNAKFARKTQLLHSRSNSTGREPHPMAMANYQSGPVSVHLPDSPPRVYNPGSSCTTPRSVYHPSSNIKLSPRESAQDHPTGSAPQSRIAQSQTSSSTVSPIHKGSNLWDTEMAQSESIVTVPSLSNEINPNTSKQAFRCSKSDVQTQAAVQAIGYANATKSRILHFLPGHLLSSSTFMPQLVTPPLTPTSPTLFLPSESSRHEAEFDTAFKFPSSPPKSTVSTLDNICGYNRHSSGLIVQDAHGTDEDHEIWIDVFSLDDYRQEDSVGCAYSSTSILDLLPSPPPTPTVFFTPPSPPSASLAPAPGPAKVDEGRLHVWRPTVKPMQVTKDDQKSEGAQEEDQEDEYEAAYSYNGLALFTLAHKQAKVAQARRCAQFGIFKMESNIRDESLPPYQTLGFDFETRLARKRASSPFAEAPLPVKSTTRIFLSQVATFVRPRPPLEEFKPLLSRKVDSSRFHARPAFQGFPGHVPTVFRNVAISKDHIGFSRHALYTTATATVLDTPPAWKRKLIGEKCVTGTA